MSRAKWTIDEVGIELMRETEVNANQMTDDEFSRLKENVRISGLSSAIACFKDEANTYHIISGNHRYKACKALGYASLPVIWADEADLTRDEIIAIQLSHNSVHGSDDKNILKKLMQEIEDVKFKDFSFINIDELENEDGVDPEIIPLSEHYSVGLVLYRQDMDALDELLETESEMSATNQLVLMINGDDTEDAFLDAMQEVRRAYEIKSTSVAFSKILELAMEAKTNGETDEDTD
jgi:hypothetical protein